MERRPLIRNALSGYGLQGVVALSALALTPYLFRRLGVDGFGTWSVIWTIATVFGLLESGATSGIAKVAAEAHGAGDAPRLHAVVRAGSLVTGAAGVVGSLVALACAATLGGIAAAGEHDAFVAGMLVVAGTELVRGALLAHGAALQGLERFDLYNAAQAAGVLVFSIGAVVAVEAGHGVLGVTVAHAAGRVVTALLFSAGMVRAGVPLRPPSTRQEDPRRLARFSSYVLLAQSMVFVGHRMDTVVVAAIRDAAAAAPYGAVLKLQSGLQSLTMPAVTLLMPMSSALAAREDRDAIAARLGFACRAALQVTLPVAGAMALFSADIVELWLGDEAPASTPAILALLMAAQVIGLSVAPAEQVLVGVGRVRPLARLAVAEGVTNVAISVGLVFAVGAVGAAIGSLTAVVLLTPWRLPLVCRALGLATPAFARATLLPAVVASLPGLAIMAAVLVALDAGPVRLAVGAAAGLGASALLAWRARGGPHRPEWTAPPTSVGGGSGADGIIG